MATIKYGSTATGTLVWTVPKLITPVSFTPQPPEPPVPPLSAKATIVSFETPITVSGTSRAVAKVTQGAPEQFRWQWQLGGTWKTGATNPASDLDHTFNRPNGANENVFPGAGNYPIRLQTLVKGIVVDQTGTLRVIQVTPDTPPPEPIPPTPVPPTGFPPVIQTSGQIFRTVAGAPWRYRGVSAFKLCRLFTDGQDIDPFLSAYAGFNVLRVWDYTDWNPGGWASCTPDQWRAFLRYVGERGWTVELTLLTTDEAARVPVAQALVNGLAVSPKPTNLLIEIGNEPDTHKSINTKALKPACDASGFVYASGNYEDSTKAFGSYLCAHTPRDNEWPRRAHDLLEYYNGHGPHKPEDPAHKCPCVADEPAKLQDVSGDRVNDWRAYFGTAAILGAGATFHSETGKFGQPPTATEQVLIAAALEGLNAFPADAPIGAYTRPSDKSLRTYVVGNYSVRIRPTTSTHPVSGFSRTGASDILWRR